jgi:hypothetical protein
MGMTLPMTNNTQLSDAFSRALTPAPGVVEFYHNLREVIAEIDREEALKDAGDKPEKEETVPFTEGPWNIHRCYPIEAEPTRVRDQDGIEYFSTWDARIAKGDKILAEVHMKKMDEGRGGGWPGVEDLEEARANARLMLAAPEMYEALTVCLKALEELEAKTLVGDEGCLWPAEIARAALAKAVQ